MTPPFQLTVSIKDRSPNVRFRPHSKVEEMLGLQVSGASASVRRESLIGALCRGHGTFERPDELSRDEFVRERRAEPDPAYNRVATSSDLDADGRPWGLAPEARLGGFEITEVG